MTTGTPIAVVEQLAETAHRTRVEEVEALMISEYSHEMRRVEVEAARTTSSYEARCISEISELRQSASRAEMGNHENMGTELAVAQNQLQSLSNPEAVAKQLADEMNIARVQMASVESSVQKTISDMMAEFEAEFEQREQHLHKKLESDVQAHAHTISIQKNRIAAQTKEMAEQNALITELLR